MSNNKDDANKYNTDGKFDVQKFNKAFEQNKEQSLEKMKKIDDIKLNELNNMIKYVPIYNKSSYEILVGIKDTWFDILDELLEFNFSMSIFTKNDRLFYIGLTIIIIVMMVYLYNSIITFDDNKDTNKNTKEDMQSKKIIEIHHIYHNKELNNLENENNIIDLDKEINTNK
jgi:hypothetical protein